MNINGLIGKKVNQTQTFLEDGRRVPMSLIMISPNFVAQIKSVEKEGYHAVQLATDTKKRANKATQGHAKKAGIENTPRFFREVRVQDAVDVEVGTALSASDVFKPGDVIDVEGVSKGKGFAGGVKRHHFRGGPRTHGQSDRERAPGSIGQTTTPGRVYKGKRMAGHMGVDSVTIKNLTVLDVVGDTLYVLGLVPGPKGAMVTLNKVGENKKFVPIFKRVEEVPVEVVEALPAEEENPVKEEPANEVPAEVEVASSTEEVQKNEEETQSEETKEEVKEEQNA